MRLSLTYGGLWYVFDDSNAADTAGLAGLLGAMPLLDSAAWYIPFAVAPQASDRTAGSVTTPGTNAAQAETMPVVHAALAQAAAEPATPTPGFAPLLKGFNFVADVDGSYQNTKLVANSLTDMVSSTNSNAVALTEDYGIDAKTSSVYADYSTGIRRPATPKPSTALANTIQAGRGRSACRSWCVR